MEEISIKYNGFEPTQDLKIFLARELKLLEQNCPADSHIDMTLSQRAPVWHGEINVAHTAHKFYAKAESSTSFDTVNEVLSDIKVQIKRWTSIERDLKRWPRLW